MAPRHLRFPALVAGLALIAASCTTQAAPDRATLPALESSSTTAAAATSLPTGISATDAGRLDGLAGRILILRADSSIVSILPDGAEPVVLAAERDEVIARTQPTWSPDGSQVAWTEQVDADVHDLVVVDADGVERSRSQAPMLAQYLAWSPAGDAIAFMGNDFWGAMTLAYAAAGTDATVIDSGAPMYIDWDPDGTTLLIHIEDRFERIYLTEGRRKPIHTDGRFRVGTHTGDRILYSVGGEQLGDILVVADPDGSGRTQLLRFTPPTAVVPHPPTDRIAVMSTWTREAVEMSQSPPAGLPVLLPEQLSVVDLATRDVTLVAEGRAVSWSWSPDGTHLLYSTVELIGDSQKIVWHTWDGVKSADHDVFTPTSLFGNSYLAFFDQHERSTTLWSPDSSAFVYAGGLSDGPAGIWVQPLDGGGPVLVAEGISASWSP